MVTLPTYYHLNVHSHNLEAYITPTEEPMQTEWTIDFFQTLYDVQKSALKSIGELHLYSKMT